MNTQRLSFLVLLFLFIGFAAPLRAQMTDEQVIQYVQQGMQAGKGQAQIGKELLLKGVSKSQLEQLRDRYASESDSESSYGNSRGRSSSQSRTRKRTSVPNRRIDYENGDRSYYDRRSGSGSLNDRYGYSDRYDRTSRRTDRMDDLMENADDFEYSDEYLDDPYMMMDAFASDSLGFDLPFGMSRQKKRYRTACENSDTIYSWIAD